MSQTITFYSYTTPAAIPIVSGTDIDLLTNAPMVLSQGTWAVSITGEIINTTAGNLTADNIGLSFGTTIITLTLNDQFVPINTTFGAANSSYFTKTFIYNVPSENSDITLECIPVVEGPGFTISLTCYAQRIV